MVDGKWNKFRDDVTHDGHKVDWGKWAITGNDPVFGGTGNPDTGAPSRQRHPCCRHGAPLADSTASCPQGASDQLMLLNLSPASSCSLLTQSMYAVMLHSPAACPAHLPACLPQGTTTVPRQTWTTSTPSCAPPSRTGWGGCSTTSASAAGGWTLSRATGAASWTSTSPPQSGLTCSTWGSTGEAVGGAGPGSRMLACVRSCWAYKQDLLRMVRDLGVSAPVCGLRTDNMGNALLP